MKVLKSAMCKGTGIGTIQYDQEKEKDGRRGKGNISPGTRLVLYIKRH